MEMNSIRVPGVVVVVVVVMMNMVALPSCQGVTCPSTGQLASACSKYVVGSNPPVPPPTSSCCALLKGSSPSCLCSALPPNAASVISKKGLANVKSSCKLGSLSCPGFSK